MMVSIPYAGVSAIGAHSVPNMNLKKPTFAIKGAPVVKRYIVIVISANTEKSALIANTPYITFSRAVIIPRESFIYYFLKSAIDAHALISLSPASLSYMFLSSSFVTLSTGLSLFTISAIPSNDTA